MGLGMGIGRGCRALAWVQAWACMGLMQSVGETLTCMGMHMDMGIGMNIDMHLSLIHI